MDDLKRIRKEIRELLHNHGGSVPTNSVCQLYFQRYGKPLITQGQMVNPQLRAMTRGAKNGRKSFLAFATQHLGDVMEYIRMLDSDGAFHLLSAGGAARLPDVLDPTTEAAMLLRIKREIRELILNLGGSVPTKTISQLYLRRYEKPLTTQGQMADLQLRAMTRSGYEYQGRKKFLAFATQHLDDVVELNRMSEGSDTLDSSGGTFHLLGTGGAARLPDVQDPTLKAATLLRIKQEIRELLHNHGGSVRTDKMAPLYFERYGKPLTTLRVMADPQLRDMTRGTGRQTFLAFATQHLDDVVELNPMSEGSDTLDSSGGAFHLLGAGGAARVPDVQDPTSEAATLLRIKREIRELLLNHGGSIRLDRMATLYFECYGKLLIAAGAMADPQLRAMTNTQISQFGLRGFRDFAAQHLERLVKVQLDGKYITVQLNDSYAEEDGHVAGTRGRMGATSAMSPGEVIRTLWAWGQLSETWTVDETQVSAVNGELSRVAGAMTIQDACQVLLAWGKLTASGLKITSMLGEADMDAMFARVGELEHQMRPSQKHMIDEALDLIRTASLSQGPSTTLYDAGSHQRAAPSDGASPSSAEELSDDASVESAFDHVGDTYMFMLPTQKRASLLATTSAAATPAAKWALVFACAEADTTKARAVARLAVIEANAALLTTHITSL
jgi:hypothetical protein